MKTQRFAVKWEMFLQEVNEEADRKEKGHSNGWKDKKAAMLRPALAIVAYRRLCVTLLSGYWSINCLIPWQVLQYVLTGHVCPRCGVTPGPPPLCPRSHTHTNYQIHPAMTAVPIR